MTMKLTMMMVLVVLDTAMASVGDDYEEDD